MNPSPNTNGRELDPLSLAANTGLAEDLYFARQYDQAMVELRKTLEMDPNFAYAHRILGSVYLQKGMFEDTIAEFRKVMAVSGDEPGDVAKLAHAYALAGKAGEATKTLNELRGISKRRYVSPIDMAELSVGLGDKNGAIVLLEKAHQDHSTVWRWRAARTWRHCCGRGAVASKPRGNQAMTPGNHVVKYLPLKIEIENPN